MFTRAPQNVLPPRRPRRAYAPKDVVALRAVADVHAVSTRATATTSLKNFSTIARKKIEQVIKQSEVYKCVLTLRIRSDASEDM
jgi:hypothetical protein